ncbi:Unknown protein [Striga hermonthica]|uniref:Myb/SANT-like domain-containing protein n=1 Tax=Striga hermonthica TaxID=68872 RepID=A0A9N7RGA0_STRHE|nr:Unknown protein [Striga hermonthica]
MRTRWSLWKQLKDKETGLGWDHMKGTIDATDEWWALKIKENSKYEVFREEGIEIELECKMDQIFAISAQGKLKFTPVSSSQQKHVMQEVDEVYVPSPLHESCNDNYGGDNCCVADESWDGVWTKISPTCTSTPIASPGNIQIEANDGRKGKRSFVGDFSQSSKATRNSGKRARVAAIQEMLGGIMQTISKRNHLTEEITTSMKNMMSLHMDIVKSMKEKSYYDLRDTMAKLCTLSDLTATSPEFFFACTMFEDPQKRIIFFGLPDDNSRVEYIKYMYKEHKKNR